MKQLLLAFSILYLSLPTFAQHTFSIVAVDPTTRQVGSAGATCLNSSDCGGCPGAQIISDLVPNVGAVNAQAQVCLPNSNLNNAIGWMIDDFNPDEVLTKLLNNDDCMFGDTGDRQYGIADLDGNDAPRTTAYTGDNCLVYANHIIGDNYAIQGNILIGQEVLDGMESGYLNTSGTLAEKLMGALQGANIPGADSRCLDEGTSSRSAFLRVACPDDTNGNFCLDLNVPELTIGQEPIDSVQTLFDEWFLTEIPELEEDQLQIYPSISEGEFYIKNRNQTELQLDIYTLDGMKIMSLPAAQQSFSLDFAAKGIYVVLFRNEEGETLNTQKIIRK